MTTSSLLGALYATYIAAAAACFVGRALGARSKLAVEAIHVAAVTIAVVLAFVIGAKVLSGGPAFLFHDWLMVDPLGCIFAGLVAVVGFLSGLYSVGYLRYDIQD